MKRIKLLLLGALVPLLAFAANPIYNIGLVRVQNLGGQYWQVVGGSLNSYGICLVPDNVPDSLGGGYIIQIADRAFYENQKIKGIILNRYITKIGEQAFYDCQNLMTFAFSDYGAINLSTIGDEAFARCSNLHSAVDSEYGTTTTLEIPYTVTSIGVGAFYNCGMKAIRFDVGLLKQSTTSKLKTIGALAFGFCSNLTSVTIPASVTSIGNGAFAQTAALASITVESGNTAFKNGGTRNIGLVSKDGTRFLQYPAAYHTNPAMPNDSTPKPGYTGFVVPATVTSIDFGAFSYAKYLKNVVLPHGIEAIPQDCFFRATALKEITIPTEVRYIRGNAFALCSSLEKVYFMNTLIKPNISAASEDLKYSFPDTTHYITQGTCVYAGFDSKTTKSKTLYVTEALALQGTSSYSTYFSSITQNVPITIPSSGYMTLCNDFDLDLSSTASTLKIYAVSGANSTALTTKEITSVVQNGKTVSTRYIPSRTGTNHGDYTAVVLKGTAGTTYNAKLGIYDFSVNGNQYQYASMTNRLKGMVTETYFPKPYRSEYYYLVLNGGKFCFLNSTGMMPAHKGYAYLTNKEGAALFKNAKGKELDIIFDDEDAVTGIQNVDNGQTVVDHSGWYTLNGCKLSEEPIQKGVYIRNGKKVVVK